MKIWQTPYFAAKVVIGVEGFIIGCLVALFVVPGVMKPKVPVQVPDKVEKTVAQVIQSGKASYIEIDSDGACSLMLVLTESGSDFVRLRLNRTEAQVLNNGLQVYLNNTAGK